MGRSPAPKQIVVFYFAASRSKDIEMRQVGKHASPMSGLRITCPRIQECTHTQRGRILSHSNYFSRSENKWARVKPDGAGGRANLNQRICTYGSVVVTHTVRQQRSNHVHIRVAVWAHQNSLLPPRPLSPSWFTALCVVASVSGNRSDIHWLGRD